MRYGVRKKKELVLWGILCMGLILLYLLSSTDWIIKEKEAEVYPVSLIISDTSDDDYVNFRKGVDQAAVEYNVDVSFITLYEKDNLAQQMDNPYIGKAGEMKQGLTEVLEKQGFSYTIVPRGTDDTYRSVIEKTVYPGSGTAVVAALDSTSTAEAAEIIGGSSVYGKYISGLYGVGMMPSLLDQLDKGTIRGLVVTNQFDAGYFAVKKAVQAIEKEQERSQFSLESYYIEKDELRSKKYEKMLYPID